MSITIYKASITHGEELVKELLRIEFNIDISIAEKIAKKEAAPHFEQYKDSCCILAESTYIDRVFRDSYYHYYSSKLNRYNRDCIRLSFFDGDIDLSQLRKTEYISQIKDQYRGFIILRPTIPFIIGRSVISPRILKNNNFQSCSVIIPTTFNGIKLSVEGFPHSSQDTETISCAETTLWATMEYFSNKYPDYCPILPSKIIATLNKVTTERQLPSMGLNVQQLSFALREFGFGTKIYSKDVYGEEFERLISTYIDSGIPLILAIDNRPAGTIGHAILCIGHETVTEDKIDQLTTYPFVNKELQQAIELKGQTVYDYDAIKKDFIFIDDNFPAYQKANLSSPTLHYGPDWENCKIKHFIAPLYHKIYLEAFEAKNFILKYLIQGPEPIVINSNLLIKVFLTSSRSFKDGLSLSNDFQPDIRDILLDLLMPKFIWVGELGTKNFLKQNHAEGIIILDATEPNILYSKPLLFAAYNGFILKINHQNAKFEKELLPLHPFKCFTNNLKS